MSMRAMRLGLAVVWLMVGVGLLLRGTLFPEWAARQDGNTLDVGSMLALAFAGWNLVRWIGSAPRPAGELPAHRRPLEPNRDGDRKDEYLPEFDFSKQDRPGGQSA